MVTWHAGAVPPDIPIMQVYGFLFTNDGKLLIFKEDETYSLPGGHPEPFDDDIEGTFRREVIEEVNVNIDMPAIVGYRYIDSEYAQVRMAALIKEIGPVQPDPATGRTYERYLVSPEEAIELLNWRDDGEVQVKSAVEVMRSLYGLCNVLR